MKEGTGEGDLKYASFGGDGDLKVTVGFKQQKVWVNYNLRSQSLNKRKLCAYFNENGEKALRK